MFNSGSLSVNSKGHLTIGGADTATLAAQYGTPLYVMDEDLIIENCRRFRLAMQACYAESSVAYACKAFCCKEICRIADREGLHLDVVSAGELYTALAAGFPAGRIILHGSNKSAQELSMAIENGVGRIVADHITELLTINRLAAEAQKTVDVLLRIKPGVDVHTHHAVITGNAASKFGFSLEHDEALQAVKTALSSSNIQLIGLHCHIGSQIAEPEPFAQAAQVMAGFLGRIKQETGLELNELNLGGGFAIRYTEEDAPDCSSECIRQTADALSTACARNGIQTPRVFIEPGRAIVGPAGLTLYTVGAVKRVSDALTYVSVDGGMADNPRYALYQSRYTAIAAGRMGEEPHSTVTVAGRCCESGDIIGEQLLLPDMHPGELLAVLCTGAYNYSMASNYNRLPKPAVVMVSNGKPRIVVQRQSLDDLMNRDV